MIIVLIAGLAVLTLIVGLAIIGDIKDRRSADEAERKINTPVPVPTAIDWEHDG